MQIKSWLYKYRFLLLAFVILTVITFVIKLSTPQKPKPTTTTVPKIELTPSQTLPKNFSQTFKNQSNILVTDTSRILSLTGDKQLVLSVNGQSTSLSPDGLKVVTYNSLNDAVVFETGVYAGDNNRYFFFDLANNYFSELFLNSLKPITSFAVNQDKTSVAVLGKYDSKSYTSNLYLVNPLSGYSDLKLEGLSATRLQWLDQNTLLIEKEVDQSEPNHWLTIFQTTTGKAVPKDVPSVKKSISIDRSSNTLYFVQSVNKDLISFSPNDLKLKKIGSVSSLNVETIPFPKTKSLVILEVVKGKVLLSYISLESSTISKTNDIPLKDTEVYIEKFISGENLILKVYDKTTKEYSLRTVSL